MCPCGFDPPAPFEPVKCGIERSLLNPENVAGDLLHPLRDGPAMLWTERECPQNEQIERALRESRRALPRYAPLLLLQDLHRLL
jgi:hypothetical protein